MIGTSILRKVGQMPSGPGSVEDFKLERIPNIRVRVISMGCISLVQVVRVDALRDSSLMLWMSR